METKSEITINTPVLFLVFNRPDTTKKVFEKIREVKPKKLYLASDGPREGNTEDPGKVIKAREIASNIDWPCELKTLFRDKNLGCKKGVSNAIDWFFENEKEGIILEDDCLPHQDFFTFCQKLLYHYSDYKNIIAITGNNFQNGIWRGDGSYYFSKYNHCWGWATWKRAWSHYQDEIKFWSEWKNSNDWHNYITDKIERKRWEKIFDEVYAGQIDSWAYPWTASAWFKKGLTVTPNVNLVSNIGFRDDATHTLDSNDKNANLPIGGIGKIIHPNKVSLNLEADKYNFDNFYNGQYLRFPNNLFRLPRKIIGLILRKLKIMKIIRYKN